MKQRILDLWNIAQKNHLTRSSLLGFLLFFLTFVLIFEISYHQGFSSINDMISSGLLTLSFIFAFIIYLINQKLLSNHYVIQLIQQIPSYIPFSHTLKSYLLSLIKIEYKIIVLLRSLDEKNYEWTLTQISAYNHILMHNQSISEIKQKGDIEFIFVRNKSNDIDELIHHCLDTTRYRYIIITSLSKIFQDTILARQRLLSKQPQYAQSIQIIGALSSINNPEIKEIIDKDDNIIRIFPPDYDEAKTAMEFMFSKIKSAICTQKQCTHYHQKNNIIILHNGTYGRAVRDQCQYYYDRELSKIYHSTVPEMHTTQLKEMINFYSFDYKHNGKVIYDGIKSQSFQEFTAHAWQGSKNYFFIIGYEPNISNMLTYMDQVFATQPTIEKCLLFCGTASMKSWRNSIIHTLQSTQTLKQLIQRCYYLKLLIYNHQDLSHPDEGVDKLYLQFHQFTKEHQKEEINLQKSLAKILHQEIHASEDILQYYLEKEENYISIFSTLSILIAQESINEQLSLLKSKNLILQQYKNHIDILVNGDSINQYVVSALEP